MSRLEGGACEFRGATLQRHGYQYYRAALEFSNGQSVSVPLYIPIVANDPAQESKAIELAGEIGRLAARTGEVNLVDWILDGRLPLRHYLQQRLREAVSNEGVAHPLRFTSSMTMPSAKKDAKRLSPGVTLRTFWISLFSGDEPNKTAAVYVNVPAEFSAPDLAAFLDSAVEEILGPESRRHLLKSSGVGHTPHDDSEKIQRAPASYLRDRPRKDIGVEFVPDRPARRFNCSLRTRDPGLAKDRLVQLNAFIEQALSQGQPLSVADIKREAAALTAEPDSEKKSARVNPSRTGPVIVHAPVSHTTTGKPAEALRLYTALSGKPESGFELRVNVVGPDRRGTDGMYAATFGVPSECQLSMEQIETLRESLREFLHERLSSFFCAGGKFRDRDDIAFGSSGKPALTPSGAEKFRRILEGRLNTGFVENCLTAGIANPFDSNLPPHAVQKMGGLATFPQPAHADLRLINPRQVPTETSPGAIRATLVWSNTESGGDNLRQDLEFKSVDELANGVRAIDRWTADVLATTGTATLPIHSGTQVLRRIVADHLAARSQEL